MTHSEILEPGTNADICTFVSKHGAKFDFFDKIDVNGDNAHPLWKYLKHKQGGTLGSATKWNFTKFIVDKNGQVVERFAPTTSPSITQRCLRSSKDAKAGSKRIGKVSGTGSAKVTISHASSSNKDHVCQNVTNISSSKTTKQQLQGPSRLPKTPVATAISSPQTPVATAVSSSRRTTYEVPTPDLEHMFSNLQFDLVKSPDIENTPLRTTAAIKDEEVNLGVLNTANKISIPLRVDSEHAQSTNLQPSPSLPVKREEEHNSESVDLNNTFTRMKCEVVSPAVQFPLITKQDA